MLSQENLVISVNGCIGNLFLLFARLEYLDQDWNRYTFDIIGELFYGRAFGFLDEGKDQNDWIKSLDKMIPFVCLMGVAPPILRPLIGMGTMLTAAGQDIRNGV